MNKKDISIGIKDVMDDAYKESHLKGDIHASVFVKLNDGRKVKLPSMMMVFQKAAELCAIKLSPASSRILLYFISQSAYQNFIGIDVRTLMDKLKIKSKATVINALKELVESNIIIKTDNLSDSRRNDYFINPHTAWKGNSEKWLSAKKKLKAENPAQTTLFGTQMEEDTKPKKVKTDFTKAPPTKDSFDDFTDVD